MKVFWEKSPLPSWPIKSFGEVFAKLEFQPLKAEGVRVQRVLWASTDEKPRTRIPIMLIISSVRYREHDA